MRVKFSVLSRRTGLSALARIHMLVYTQLKQHTHTELCPEYCDMPRQMDYQRAFSHNPLHLACYLDLNSAEILCINVTSYQQ